MIRDSDMGAQHQGCYTRSIDKEFRPTLECSPPDDEKLSEGFRSLQLNSRVYSRPYHSQLSVSAIIETSPSLVPKEVVGDDASTLLVGPGVELRSSIRAS